MHIWISVLRKSAYCAGCGEPIALGESVVRGKSWRIEDEGKKVWSATKVWHTKNRHGLCCWLEEGLLQLEKNPWTETRGRKRTAPSDADRAKRVAILKKRGSIMQRLKRAAAVPLIHRDYEQIITLGAQLERCKEEIAPLGGIPSKW